MPGEPWTRNAPFTKQSRTDCTSVSACAGRTCSLVWLKSAKRTGRLATVRRNTRNEFTEQETLMRAITHMNGNAKVRLDPQESDTNDLLNWDVFVTPSIPTVWSDLPPGTKQLMWSPISSTLIYGKRDAVLIDAFIT